MSNPNLLLKPDVLIIGAGAAGVAAAMGAKQNGASVVVLEKNLYPGGKATASYVGTVCGLYYRSEQPEIKYAHSGFPKEFGETLSNICGSEPIRYKKGLQFLPYDDSLFKKLCNEFLNTSADSLCMNAVVNGATHDNNIVTQVTAVVDGKERTFHPRSVIDASGFNCIASFLNLESITSDRYQAAAQVFGMSGISGDDITSISMSLIRSIRKGIDSGILESWFEFISVVPGSVKNGNVLLKLPLPDETGNDPDQQQRINASAKASVEKIAGYLISNAELFKNAMLSYIAPEAGIRTGPRNLGKKILTGNDVLNAYKHPDAVARGTWPVEFWQPLKPVRMEYFAMDDHYDIPAGALQSKSVENLFFAGRNISADDTAIASARVIGSCLATGYAAGVMSASFAKGNLIASAVEKIQSELFGQKVKA